MFRKKPKSSALESESDFPADLTALGLAINTSLDCIRQISNPDEPFDYFHFGKCGNLDGTNKQERLNERRREAVDECLRRIALERLRKLSYSLIHLPSADVPNVPILVSADLKAAKKILFIAPQTTNSALGVWSLRVMQDENIKMGNMETLIKKLQGTYDGFVIANPACLCWDKRTSTAMSHVSYKARPVRQIARSAILDNDDSKIPGHEDPEHHIAAVFEYLQTQLSTDANVDVLAVGYSAYAVVRYLEANWSFWGTVLHTGVLADSNHTASPRQIKDDGFRLFLRERVRNYVSHSDPVGTLLEDVTCRLGCACFTAGENWGPRIVPTCLDEITQYLEGAWAETEEEEAINPEVGEYVEGKGNGEVIYEGEWMDKLRQLDLGSKEAGWDVPGMEEVIKLKEEAMGIAKEVTSEE